MKLGVCRAVFCWTVALCIAGCGFTGNSSSLFQPVVQVSVVATGIQGQTLKPDPNNPFVVPGETLVFQATATNVPNPKLVISIVGPFGITTYTNSSGTKVPLTSTVTMLPNGVYDWTVPTSAEFGGYKIMVTSAAEATQSSTLAVEVSGLSLTLTAASTDPVPRITPGEALELTATFTGTGDSKGSIARNLTWTAVGVGSGVFAAVVVTDNMANPSSTTSPIGTTLAGAASNQEQIFYEAPAKTGLYTVEVTTAAAAGAVRSAQIGPTGSNAGFAVASFVIDVISPLLDVDQTQKQVAYGEPASLSAYNGNGKVGALRTWTWRVTNAPAGAKYEFLPSSTSTDVSVSLVKFVPVSNKANGHDEPYYFTIQASYVLEGQTYSSQLLAVTAQPLDLSFTPSIQSPELGQKNMLTASASPVETGGTWSWYETYPVSGGKSTVLPFTSPSGNKVSFTGYTPGPHSVTAVYKGANGATDFVNETVTVSDFSLAISPSTTVVYAADGQSVNISGVVTGLSAPVGYASEWSSMNSGSLPGTLSPVKTTSGPETSVIYEPGSQAGIDTIEAACTFNPKTTLGSETIFPITQRKQSVTINVLALGDLVLNQLNPSATPTVLNTNPSLTVKPGTNLVLAAFLPNTVANKGVTWSINNASGASPGTYKTLTGTKLTLSSGTYQLPTGANWVEYIPPANPTSPVTLDLQAKSVGAPNLLLVVHITVPAK